MTILLEYDAPPDAAVWRRSEAMTRLRELVAHAARTSQMGDGFVGRAGVFAWYMLLPAKKRLAALDRRTVVLRLRIAGQRRRLAFSDRSELIALEEVFCDKEYDIALSVPPTVIVDAGANVGSTVLWFRSQYPAATIIALEPDPRTARKLAKTLAGVPGVELVEAALTDTTGIVMFVQADLSWGSHIAGEDDDGEGSVTVPSVCLADLLAERGLDTVDLLKLDVEGAEWVVLPEAVGLATDVLVEVHGPDRVQRLEALNVAALQGVVTWAGDRVAHISCLGR